MSSEALISIITDAIEDIKGQNINVIDVREQTSIADYFVIASATSNRQLKAIANNVVEKAKEKGFMPIGVEDEPSSEWVLVDLNDVIVHLMMPSAREYYDIESLWQHVPVSRDAEKTDETEADSEE